MKKIILICLSLFIIGCEYNEESSKNETSETIWDDNSTSIVIQKRSSTPLVDDKTYTFSLNDLSTDAKQRLEKMTVKDSDLQCWNDGTTYDITITNRSQEVVEYYSNNKACNDIENKKFLDTTEIEDLIAHMYIELSAIIKENKLQWEERNINSYTYIYDSDCYYECGLINPFPARIVTVENNIVVKAHVPDGEGEMSNLDEYKTIDQYYDLLEKAIDNGVDLIAKNQTSKNEYPSFDTTHVHPLEAYIEIELGNTETAYGFSIGQINP